MALTVEMDNKFGCKSRHRKAEQIKNWPIIELAYRPQRLNANRAA